MLWGVAGAACALAGIAALADRRRTSRADLESVGWVPWPLILLLALIAAAIAAGLALGR